MHISPRFIWPIAALCASLLACAVEKPSQFTGSWHGKMLHKKTFVGQGISSAGSDLYEDLKGQIWNVNDCGGGSLAVEVYPSCNVRATESGDTAAFEIGGWCDVPAKDGGTLRMSVLEGKLSLLNGKVEGTVRLALQEIPSKSGVYMEYTDTLSDTQSSLVADGGNCKARSDGAVPEQDFSAMLNCSEIVDRSDASADRTVAVVSGAITPRCMKIAIGQKVAFQSVPWKLETGAPGQPYAGSAGNPIPSMSVADPAYVPFLRPGDYLFHTTEGPGATGLIRVR